MTDNDPPPPDIAEHARAVQAWLDSQKPTAPQPQQQPSTDSAIPSAQLSGVERFKATVRSDSPPEMPAWNRDQALAGNLQPQPHERAADRFMRQRLERK